MSFFFFFELLLIFKGKYFNYNDNGHTSKYSQSALLKMTDNETITYSSFMTLESTEIDYLRQIIYAYMMGTDPVVSSLFRAIYHLLKLFFLFFSLDYGQSNCCSIKISGRRRQKNN